MSIRVALNHVTSYRYDRPVIMGPQVVRLRPAPHTRTPVLAYSLRVTPADHFINWQQDPQSNYLGRLVFPKPVTEFRVEVDLVAEMTVINPFDFFLEPAAEKWPFKYEAALEHEIEPFRRVDPVGPKMKEYLAAIPRDPARTTDFLVLVNQLVHKAIKYLIRLEPGVQTPEVTLGKASGSCRDSAWLLVQVLRNLGFAARFVSGYLLQLTPDVKSLDGPSGPESDFTDLHAWTEVYLPGAGWIGLDPTSGLFAGEGHIPLACTPDPQGAAPVTGSYSWTKSKESDKIKEEFEHRMKITRVHEDPRVTKPYTEAQWLEIEALGHRIDEEIKARDIRLTMGGEPTFVSIDDMDGPEWTTEALGERKRHLAGELLNRLKAHYAKGGLLHYGQGKWYPGEPLPRWALSCYWRRDGQPIWHDPALYADEKVNYGHCEVEAEQFIKRLALTLGVKPDHAIAAHEDVFYYIWKERRLPTNVDPFDSRLSEKEDRDRLAKVFERGLDSVVGYALPLSKGPTGHGTEWQSGSWFFRSERMYLIPGDSPMGFRLPLDSLPWVAKKEAYTLEQQDPTERRQPLAQRGEFSWRRRRAELAPVAAGSSGYTISEQRLPDTPAPGAFQSASWIIRTALCVEARHGRLHVFLPPVRTIEDFLEIIDAVEHTAGELRLPVIIEGYTPPGDPRIEHIKVTPDPGVIEVNVHPAHSWDQLVHNTTTLYEEARQSRLGTEKFMVDGRHTGTGGGNHVVIGGPTPTDSPFLRRPDVLKSLLAYWHNHPSLSYLFSGMFVGPTSQAPRVDEARNDAVYELEIAFRQIPEFATVPPWFVDRVFRNLLVDVTGNTHRAEFCIDKLYSPDHAAGRLGLVEFRAFEMPPHARMSLTQQLLLRALIARFWKTPYRQELNHWGTELHDRYMLPHFVWQDLGDVIEDMRDKGYPMQAEWFAPHLEFRFPFHGSISAREVTVELRQAIEPWLVLGEEPAGGGTVRFVDSSLERVQVKVTGMVDSRHVVTCNGRRIPLINTGTVGEYVAGVRYRAWQPASCLHPTIPVHTPLVFDLLDTWNERSVGGCTYHVMHPGGRNYSTFPVNAYEAESRRAARFFPFGHTPGPMLVPAPEPNPDFPFTLDLRY